MSTTDVKWCILKVGHSDLYLGHSDLFNILANIFGFWWNKILLLDLRSQNLIFQFTYLMFIGILKSRSLWLYRPNCGHFKFFFHVNQWDQLCSISMIMYDLEYHIDLYLDHSDLFNSLANIFSFFSILTNGTNFALFLRLCMI